MKEPSKRQGNIAVLAVPDLRVWLEIQAVQTVYRGRLLLGWPNARAARQRNITTLRILFTLLVVAALWTARALLPGLSANDMAFNSPLPTNNAAAFLPAIATNPAIEPIVTATLLATATVTNTALPPTTYAIAGATATIPPFTRAIEPTATLFPTPTLRPPTATALPRTFVPTVPPALTYAIVVQSGDSLWSIARRSNMALEQLIALNHLTLNSRIYVGQKLLIATGSAAKIVSTLPPTLTPVPTVFVIPAPTRTPAPLLPTATVRSVPTAPLGTVASFIWPVRGIITTYFSAGHPGIDIAVPMGTPIAASAAGVVTYAAWSNVGYGNFVIVDHGNYITRYAHLSAFVAHVGQALAQGQILGLSGSTGNSTGPHLHFEIWFNNHPLNPLALLG